MANVDLTEVATATPADADHVVGVTVGGLLKRFLVSTWARASRTINGHPLTADVTVTAADVGAPTGSGTSTGTNTGDQDLSGYVPATRTVNGHALSGNVVVTAADVGLYAISIDSYGAVGDGVTDDTAALTAAHAALVAAGGGVLNFAKKDYLFSSRVTLPNDGVQYGAQLPAIQVPITWQGAGNDTDSAAGPVKTPKGTRVLLGYQDATPGWVATGARLQTFGRGIFRIRGINICAAADTPVGVASTPLLLTTNTTLDLDSSVSFYGPGNRTGASADCDAIILGGTTNSLLNGNDGAFQGYATRLVGCFFSACRRIVYLRTFANAVTIRDLKAWSNCGTNLAEGAAIELYGGPDNCSGNHISGVLLEVVNYIFAVKLTKGLYNYICVHPFDAGAGTVGGVLCEASSYDNVIVAGMPLAAGRPTLVDRTTGKLNSYISNQSTEISRLFNLQCGTAGYPNSFGATTFTDPLATVFQGVGATGTGKILRAIRSAADSTDPGVEAFSVTGAGAIALGNLNGSGNITNGFPTGASWSANGKTWGFPSSSGGNMIQHSGTGGSTFTASNFSFRWTTQAGVLLGRVGAHGPGGQEAIQLGASFDVGWYRHSATVIRSATKISTDTGLGVGNSAAATTLGTLSKKMEVFDATGVSIGFVPIYTTIT